MERAIKELEKHLKVLIGAISIRESSERMGKVFSEEHTKNFLELNEERNEIEKAIIVLRAVPAKNNVA